MELKGLSKRLYNIFFHTHTVAGITISAGLFVIFYAGAFSLFRHDIHQWENQELRNAPIAQLDAEKTIAAVRTAIPDWDESKNLTIRSGTEADPTGYVFGARAVTDSTTEFFQATVDVPAGYEITLKDREQGGTTIGDTLYQLHYFGQIPRIGIYLSGLVALFFLFATVTGVLIHWQNIVKKFYAFTTKPNWKQIWTNAHTVLGMIGLPFQIVYAVTGAFFGILILLLIPSAFILFGGDNNKVIAAVRPSAAITVSDSAAVVDFDNVGTLIAEAKARYPELELRNTRFQNYGREDGIMTLNFDDHKTIFGTAEVLYRVHTGEVLFEVGPDNMDYATSVIGLIGRLHFATFGGVGLRVIYFILAMLTCFMILSGILLWQAARDKRTYTKKQKLFHHRVTKVNLAICLGLFPAVALIFILNKVFPLDFAPRTSYVEGLFFLGWLLLIIAGIWWDNYRRINRNYLRIGGVLALAVPLTNGIITGDWLWVTLSKGLFYVASVDLFWLATGVAALIGARLTQRKQAAKEVEGANKQALKEEQAPKNTSVPQLTFRKPSTQG